MRALSCHLNKRFFEKGSDDRTAFKPKREIGLLRCLIPKLGSDDDHRCALFFCAAFYDIHHGAINPRAALVFIDIKEMKMETFEAHMKRKFPVDNTKAHDALPLLGELNFKRWIRTKGFAQDEIGILLVCISMECSYFVDEMFDNIYIRCTRSTHLNCLGDSHGAFLSHAQKKIDCKREWA